VSLSTDVAANGSTGVPPSHGVPGTAPRGPESQRSGVRALWPYVRDHRFRLVLATSLALLCAGLTLAQPVLVNQLIQSVQTASAPLSGLVVALLGVIVAAAVLTGCQQYLLGEIGEGVVRGARLDLARRLLRMPISQATSREPGELVSRLTADTLLIRSAVSGGVVGLLGAGVTIVGSVVALVLIDPITFAVSTSIATTAVVVSILAARPVRRINVAVQETTGALAARVQRALVGARLLRAYDAHGRALGEIDDLIADAYHHGLRLARLSAVVGPITSTLVSLALVVAIVVGGVRAAAGGLELAGLVTFLMFFNMLVGPLNQLSAAVLQLQHAIAGHERIVQVSSIPDEEAGDVADRDAQQLLARALSSDASGPGIAFERVAYTYNPDHPRPALDDVSFTASAGRLTALVGPSGAGKSTIFHLMERFFDPATGSIRIAGADITSIDRAAVRALIGYVDQGASALSGTLRENMLLGAEGATDGEISLALQAVQLGDLVDRLDQGLDTELGQGGATVSGGERQRLSIARALVRSPRLLLLDEPTASLDGRTEITVLNVLDQLRPATTILVVAHRLATVRHADKIVVVDQGRIVDEGTHATLIGRCALYRELVRTQLA
jgi:ABC-type multidrug transport system fused ATPase/permease subunit